MIIGIPRETFPGECRVALIPPIVPQLLKAGLAGLDVVVESDAGSRAGFVDQMYLDKGARVVASRAEVFAIADVILQVRTVGANPDAGRADLDLSHAEQVFIGLADPWELGTHTDLIQELKTQGLTLFAMELIPRISRAQSMDVLSSMATVAGYKAVLLAAERLPKMFPMLVTAAGTITPARVFVVGAGVAGLQAIATARRLGAAVEAFDVRPAAKGQVLSLGAKFVEIGLETTETEGSGGYAKDLGNDVYQQQQALMQSVVARNDIVITTAAVPGKAAPVLINAEMVAAMAPGSVVVDLAAERGGNCELTKPDEVVTHNGVTILGPTNLAASVAFHASQMYAKNITTFLLHLVKNGQLQIDTQTLQDPIIRDTLLTRAGDIVHPQVRQALGLAAIPETDKQVA